MICHECAREGLTTAAISHCRFCFVGLCKDHLVASFHRDTVPQYGCDHHPELGLRNAAPRGRPTCPGARGRVTR